MLGRMTCWWGAQRIQAVSAIKWDAAEDDVAGLGPGGGLLGQQEGITLEIGVLDDFLTLIVVAQNGHIGAQLLPYLVDTLVQFFGGIAQVFRGDFLPPDIDRQLLGQRLGRQLILRATKGGVFNLGQRYGRRPGFCSHIHFLDKR